jgi:hypothetical protein
MKKYLIVALCSVAILVSVGAYQVRAAYPTPATTDDMTGWLWSPNAGWISMNGANSGAGGGSAHVEMSHESPYQNLQIATLSGYAWSSSLGWLSFNYGDIVDCPQETPVDYDQPSADAVGLVGGSKCVPRVHVTGDVNENGKVSGWARFLQLKTSPTEGGWVHLSGANHGTKGVGNAKGVQYDPISGAFSGLAWSPDAGWISFDAKGPGAATDLTVSLSASPRISGTAAEMASIQFTANVGGTVTGDLVYTFSCGNGTADRVFNVVNASFNSSYPLAGICDYSTSGTGVASLTVTRGGLSANDNQGITVNPVASALDLKIKRPAMTSFVTTGISIKKGESFMLALENTNSGCSETVISNPGTAGAADASDRFQGSNPGTSWNPSIEPPPDSDGLSYVPGTARTPITIPGSRTTSLATGRYEIKISCTSPTPDSKSVFLNVSNSTIIER